MFNGVRTDQTGALPGSPTRNIHGSPVSGLPERYVEHSDGRTRRSSPAALGAWVAGRLRLMSATGWPAVSLSPCRASANNGLRPRRRREQSLVIYAAER